MRILKRVDDAWIEFISGVVRYWCIVLNERRICNKSKRQPHF